MGFKPNSQSITLINRNQLDRLLKEALYGNSIGCIDSTLNGIAQASHHMPFYELISKRMWSAINSKPSKWLYVQKGLTLLEYLVLNGAEWCTSDVLQHLEDINKAVKSSREYSAKTNFLTGKPLAPPHIAIVITEKCKNLIDLVRSGSELAKKREQVAKNKDRYIGVGQKNGVLEISTLHKPVIAVDYSKSLFSRQKNSIQLGLLEYEQAKAPPHNFTFPYVTNDTNISSLSKIPSKQKSFSESNDSDSLDSYDNDDPSSSLSSSLSSSSLSSSSDSDDYNVKHDISVNDTNSRAYNSANRIPTSYSVPTSFMPTDNSTFFSNPMPNYKVPYADMYTQSDRSAYPKTQVDYTDAYKPHPQYAPHSKPIHNYQNRPDPKFGKNKVSNPFAY